LWNSCTRKSNQEGLSNVSGSLAFYESKVKSFAFDIMTLPKGGGLLETIAQAYLKSGKCRVVASVYLSAKGLKWLCIAAKAFPRENPLMESWTPTPEPRCFADYIQAFLDNGDISET